MSEVEREQVKKANQERLNKIDSIYYELQKHKYFTQRHSLLYTYNYALWLKMCYPTSWSQPHSCLPVNCLQ